MYVNVQFYTYYILEMEKPDVLSHPAFKNGYIPKYGLNTKSLKRSKISKNVNIIETTT
jgi:hypothetical protein